MFSEAAQKELMKIAAEAVVENFVAKGAQPTFEEIEQWVNNNKEQIEVGFQEGVRQALASCV